MRMDGWTDRQMDERTDMTKVILAFRNFANAPKSLFEKETRPEYAFDEKLPY